MNRKALRVTTTSLYLTVLAVTDLILLYIGLFSLWLQQQFGIQRALTNTCPVFRAVINFAVQFEAWIIVSVSLERLVAVWFPVKHKYYFTRPKAAMGLVILAIPLIAETSHFYYTHDISTCNTKKTYIYFGQFIYPWISITLASLLPFLIMFLTSIGIVWKLLKNKQAKKKFSSMTITLFTVSVTFFITTCPICIIIIAFPILMKEGDTTVDEFHNYVIARGVFNLLYYINNAINFVLYCLSGRRFRRELLIMIGFKNRISPEHDFGSTSGQPGNNLTLKVHANDP